MSTQDLHNYHGGCHCGRVRFSFTSPEITEGVCCNCSFCNRRQAMMLPFMLPADELKREAADADLGCYQFGNHNARHYFCRVCGIYTFHESSRKPGHYRVNLGCVDGLDACSLPRSVFNGRELL